MAGRKSRAACVTSAMSPSAKTDGEAWRRPPNTERLSRPDGSNRKRGIGRPPHVAGIESLRLAHGALRNMDK